MKGSDYLGDQDAIEILASEALGDIYQLEHWGCVFSRNDEGTLAQRPFGAAGSPRTVYSADITGHVLIHVLYEQLMKRQEQGPLEVYEEYFAWRLVIEDGRCVGVICWDLVRGGLGSSSPASRSFSRRAAWAASIARPRTPMRATATAWPWRFSRWPAAQGHGVHAVPSDDALPERRPDHRGLPREGGFLINRDGERFMARYAPNALELASRDVVSRSETTEIEGGRGVNGSAARPAPPRPRAHPHAAPRVARELDDLRRSRPDLRPDPRPAGRALPHGRSGDGQLGPPRSTVSTRPVRSRASPSSGANWLEAATP